MPGYDESFIVERARSGPGKESGRARGNEDYFQRAMAGDPVAREILRQRTGLFGVKNIGGEDYGGWGTADNQNYAQLLYSKLDPSFRPQYREADDGGSFINSVGKGLGGALKVAAPFAGLIPGVGPLVGAGLAAGGSALGGALSGDKFDLLDTVLAGGAGYLGGKWNPFGGSPGSGLSAASGLGNATQSGAGAGGSALSQVGNAGVGALPSGAYQAFPGIPGASVGTPGYAGGGSILDRVFGGGGGGGGGFLDKVMQYGPMVLGGISSANRQRESDKLTEAAWQGAQADWESRAPLRTFAQGQILSLPSLQEPNLDAIFADPSNPYYRGGRT